MNRFTQDKVNKFNEGATSVIDNLSDAFNEGINMFSANGIVESTVKEYKKYKRRCFFVRFVTLVICGIIIYLHLWGNR